MIQRILIKQLQSIARKMPVVSVTGPRQSGKTTFTKQCFPGYDYVNLEHPPTLEKALHDPEHFLKSFKKGLIIDEAQHAPQLFSYIQVFSDESRKSGQYILTGSQNFLLLEKITQSLAGRVAVHHLLPFSIQELRGTSFEKKKFGNYIVKGFYPRLYDKKIPEDEFYSSYIQTYLERDVRQVTAVHNMNAFQKLLKLCAGRTAQMINYASLAVEIGISEKTVRHWLSILETSFVLFFLQPYHRNFRKRIVKTPKLYFTDVGLASYLLGIKTEKQLHDHFAKGALFENMVIADIMKNQINSSMRPQLYFWRDNTGNEIDCLLENASELIPIEIKSGKTIHEDFFKGLKYFQKLAGAKPKNSYLIYGGAESHTRSHGQVIGWNETDKIKFK